MNMNQFHKPETDRTRRKLLPERDMAERPPTASQPINTEEIDNPPGPISRAASHLRMVALEHQGPLPWVQLRNAVYNNAIFRKMVGRISPEASNGDLVTVYDRDGVIFGTGLLNTQSQLALRMLSYHADPMDEEFLTQRLGQAIALRRDALKLDQVTDAWRVVHGEGDGLPGLIVDRLGEYAVVELFSLAMYLRRHRIEEALRELLGVREVLFRADEKIENAEGFRLPQGSGPAARGNHSLSETRLSTIISENGLRFQIDLAGGHKTGFFCDQRDNRLALTHFTEGAQVLDVCCYTGGFGIYAAKSGKADSVTGIDLDENVIALARRNANLNHIPPAAFQLVHADSFPYLRQMKQNGRSYGVIVLDPPKLVPSRLDFAEGRQKYFDLNKLALSLMKPGGLLLSCSCSGLVDATEFTNIIRGAARSAQRRVQLLALTGPGMDHPVATDFLEGGYLKCLWCRVF